MHRSRFARCAGRRAAALPLLFALGTACSAAMTAPTGERWEVQAQLVSMGRPFGPPQGQSACRPADWRSRPQAERLPLFALLGCPDLAIARGARGDVRMEGDCGALRYRLHFRYLSADQGEGHYAFEDPVQRIHSHSIQIRERRIGPCDTPDTGAPETQP